jgi:hypothetical protein|tara:strand:+ start:423 stop:644 length:222 start_codon:yes stop_codon:yes gene_type:complete
MNIEIEYGNTIYNNDKIAKYTKFQFDTLNDLEQFWVIRTDEGDWKADLKSLVITHQMWVDSKEFFMEAGREEE